MKNFMRIFVLCLALSMSIAHATSSDDSSLEKELSALIDKDSDGDNTATAKTEAASVSDCNCDVPESDSKPLVSKKTGINQEFAADLKKSLASDAEENIETKEVAKTADDSTKKQTAALDAASLNALYMAAYQQGYQQAQMAAMYSQQYSNINSNPGVSTLTNSLASINSSLNTTPATTVVNGTYPSFSIYNPSSSLYTGQNSISGILPALSMNNYGGYNYNAYGTNGVLAAPTYTSYGTSTSGVLLAPSTGTTYSSTVLAAPRNYSNMAMGSTYMMGGQMRNPYMNSYGMNSGATMGFGFNVRLGMGY